jgi:hypothetical protein
LEPKIETDTTEPPIIDVLVEPLGWNEIESYVRIAQRFLLAEVPGTGQFKGVYRAGDGVEVTDDLGINRDAALSKFRNLLRQPGRSTE